MSKLKRWMAHEIGFKFRLWQLQFVFICSAAESRAHKKLEAKVQGRRSKLHVPPVY